MRTYGLWAVAGMLFLVGLARADQVYRWTDESGRVHYSNVGPGRSDADLVGEIGESEGRDETPDLPDSLRPQTTEASKKKDDPYAGLSEESFSTTVSRQRADLKRDLDAARAQIKRIDAEIRAYQTTRRETFEQYGQQLQGVVRPEPASSDEEKELLERREKIERQIESIRASYDKLKDSAIERHGSLPAWWRPLD